MQNARRPSSANDSKHDNKMVFWTMVTAIATVAIAAVSFVSFTTSNGEPPEPPEPPRIAVFQVAASQPATGYDCEFRRMSQEPGDPCLQSSVNYGGNVQLLVDSIAVGPDRMAWHISFFNRSTQAASLAFGVNPLHKSGGSFLTDDRGNRYDILRTLPENFLNTGIPTGVKNSGVLIFKSPSETVHAFNLQLKLWTYGTHRLRYPNSGLSVYRE